MASYLRVELKFKISARSDKPFRRRTHTHTHRQTNSFDPTRVRGFVNRSANKNDPIRAEGLDGGQHGLVLYVEVAEPVHPWGYFGESNGPSITFNTSPEAAGDAPACGYLHNVFISKPKLKN